MRAIKASIRIILILEGWILNGYMLWYVCLRARVCVCVCQEEKFPFIGRMDLVSNIRRSYKFNVD